MLDRLYLGGPTDVRGFAQHGACPTVDACALGGASLLAGAVHVYRPLYPANMVYAHAFATAGNTQFALHTMRASCGVGELCSRCEL